MVDTKTTTFAAGAQVAYGFNPTFGAFGNVRLAFVNGTQGDSDAGSTNFTLGTGLSTDLGPLTRVPVGFLLGYTYELDAPSASGSDDTSTSTLTGGVFYTGRPDLALGIEGSVSFAATGKVSFTIYTTNFGIHYFW